MSNSTKEITDDVLRGLLEIKEHVRYAYRWEITADFLHTYKLGDNSICYDTNKQLSCLVLIGECMKLPVNITKIAQIQVIRFESKPFYLCQLTDEIISDFVYFMKIKSEVTEGSSVLEIPRVKLVYDWPPPMPVEKPVGNQQI